METGDIQQTIFDIVKRKLTDDQKLSQVIQDDLSISSDAAYRRIRGDVALTIYETKILSEKYAISFDNIGEFKKDKVIFDYKPLSKIDFNFESYLTGMRDNLRQIKSLDNPNLFISVNDTPILQLFNFPHFTRFKFFFWAKSYLKIDHYKDLKFKYENIDIKIGGNGRLPSNLPFARVSERYSKK